MTIPRLFQKYPLKVDDTHCLDDTGFHHLIRVLRHRINEPVILFNDEGGEYHGRLTKVTNKEAYIHIQQFLPREKESPLTIHLYQGIARGEKMDFILQKSTELGVTHITPLYTERSNVKLSGQRLIKRQQHWQQIIISACEQCGRNRLPTLHPPMPIEDAFRDSNATAKYLFHLSGNTPLTAPLPSHIAIAIGAEGGFSPREEEQARLHHWQCITLGPRILRTETASLAALATVQWLAGDFC